MGHDYLTASKSRARPDILNGWTLNCILLLVNIVCHKMRGPGQRFALARKIFRKSCACANLRQISRSEPIFVGWRRVQPYGPKIAQPPYLLMYCQDVPLP